MIDSILVPLDGSLVAEAILLYVQPFARLTGASVTLLRVTDPLEGLGDFEPAAVWRRRRMRPARRGAIWPRAPNGSRLPD